MSMSFNPVENDTQMTMNRIIGQNHQGLVEPPATASCAAYAARGIDRTIKTKDINK